jgi:hypothetical protein
MYRAGIELVGFGSSLASALSVSWDHCGGHIFLLQFAFLHACRTSDGEFPTTAASQECGRCLSARDQALLAAVALCCTFA